MKRASKQTTELASFSFVANVLGETIRVEWDPRGPVAVLDQETANALLHLGYAKSPTEDQVTAYNDLIDEIGEGDDTTTPKTGDTGEQGAGTQTEPPVADPDKGLTPDPASQGGNETPPAPTEPPPPPPPPSADEIAADAKKKAEDAAAKLAALKKGK